MKCYDFELNISAYIEGGIQPDVRQDFYEHKEKCKLCNKKLIDVSEILNKMPSIAPIITSKDFIHNLNKKIQEIDSRGPSIWKRLKEFRPYGFQPIPALGFSIAIIMVISASYLLIDSDRLPEINMDKLSNNSNQNSSSPFKPSLVIPPYTKPSIAESDSTPKPDNRTRYDNKIKLTGGK